MLLQIKSNMIHYHKGTLMNFGKALYPFQIYYIHWCPNQRNFRVTQRRALWHFIVYLIAINEMNSFSVIILGYYIKVKHILTSLKAIFEKSLLHKIYSSYTHLGGSLV